MSFPVEYLVGWRFIDKLSFVVYITSALCFLRLWLWEDFLILSKAFPISIKMIVCFCTCIYHELLYLVISGCWPILAYLGWNSVITVYSFFLNVVLTFVSKDILRLVCMFIRKTGLWFSSVLAMVSSNFCTRWCWICRLVSERLFFSVLWTSTSISVSSLEVCWIHQWVHPVLSFPFSWGGGRDS